MSKKKDLGQFYTTNSEYIISNLVDIFPEQCTVIDPFVGEGDLLKLLKNHKFIGYDIDKKIKGCIEQDTLINPPKYDGKWVLTNPPYLARNKNKDKTLYDKYKLNDLYKIAIKTMIGCDGGVLIIPINFFSGDDSKLRNEFLSKYKIIKMNIFEESVFDDTTYTVCSFSFVKSEQEKQTLDITFFPSKINKKYEIDKCDNFLIGAEITKLLNRKHKIKRLRIGDNESNSNLYLRAIDTGSMSGRISLQYRDKQFFAKETDRTFATIVLEKNYSKEEQKIIAKRFNEVLEEYRNKYNSLFLTNYRNSGKTYARKRIGFDMAYSLIDYVIKELHL